MRIVRPGLVGTRLVRRIRLLEVGDRSFRPLRNDRPVASSFSDLIAGLECERAAFVDALDGLSADQRTSRPSNDAWSPIEIAEHVYRSEQGFLKGLERQLDPDGERRELGKPSRTRFLALIAALKSPKKFKVPGGTASAANPGGMAYEEIRANWAEFPERWKAIITAFPDSLSNTGLIRHPISGPMTLTQTIKFLTVHAARHFKQLERTLRVLES